MDYFHTDSPTTLDWLARVVMRAEAEGMRLRFRTQGTTLQVKLGEGTWTAPIESTPDPYRDNSGNTVYDIIR